MQELLEMALKRIDALERRLEKYFTMLKVDNEIDFILKGTYITEQDLADVLSGTYEEVENV